MLCDFERFDPREGVWRQLPHMSERRGYCAASFAMDGALYVGGGCNHCPEALKGFVERTNIPVAQTLMGLGAFLWKMLEMSYLYNTATGSDRFYMLVGVIGFLNQTLLGRK